MTLQDAYYIIGIIFMSLMLIILLALLAAIVVIRAKVVAIHRTIDEKIESVLAVPRKGAQMMQNVKKAMTRQS